jgi:hypothetical protein
VFRQVSDPVELGQGLGLTQGFCVGVVIALILLVLMTWHSQRVLRAAELKAVMKRVAELERTVNQLQQSLGRPKTDQDQGA